MNQEIKVFIVDDYNLEKDLLIQSFSKHPRIRYFGQAGNGKECLERLKNRPTDVVLMDIHMPPGIDGIETAKCLLKQKKEAGEKPPKILFLTGFGDYSFAEEALRMRASLIGKMVSAWKLMEHIEQVYQGEIIINPNPQALQIPNKPPIINMIIKNLLDETQIKIACKTREGLKAEDIAALLNVDIDFINNQKKVIRDQLRKIYDGNLNSASLGALMEASGLCDDLKLKDLDPFLPKFKFD